MWKKHKIVVLPNDKSQLSFYKDGNTYSYAEGVHYGITNVMIPHHIYILSDEEIKEGDWCFMPKDGILMQEIVKINSIQDYKDAIRITGRRRYKIIASTDKYLNLPAPTDEFLKEWVNNPVDEVEVEYEFWNGKITKYPISTNNTIKCRFIQTQDSWDDIIEKYSKYSRPKVDALSYIKWLKQNYEAPKPKKKHE